MPIVIERKSSDYKDSLPDKFMKLKLNKEELSKFFEMFPGLKETETPISDEWEPATIKVEITVEAFKKKSNGKEEK